MTPPFFTDCSWKLFALLHFTKTPSSRGSSFLEKKFLCGFIVAIVIINLTAAMNNEQFGALHETFKLHSNRESEERAALALAQSQAAEARTLAQVRAAERQATVSQERSDKHDRAELLKTQIANTVKCSGATSMSVRHWFAEVDLARPYFAEHLSDPHQTLARDIDTMDLCRGTLQGEMRRCYEAFIMDQPNRNLVTWQEIKNHLTMAYLTADEQEYLKSALEKTKQRAEENNGSYGRRYTEAANMAYPATARNAAVEAILLNGYIKGLRKTALKLRLIQEVDPETVKDAIKAIERFTVQALRMKRVEDNEHDPRDAEPMEVGAVLPSAVSPSPNTALLAMQRRMEGMQKELTKLKSTTIYVADPRQPPPAPLPLTVSYARAVTPLLPTPDALSPTRSKRPPPVNPMGGPSYTPDKQPICYECQGIGHVAKSCEVRRVWLARVAANLASQQFDAPSGN